MLPARYRLALKVALSLALLGIAASLIDFRRFGEVLARIDPLWMVCAIGVWIAYQAMSAFLVVALLDGGTTVAKVWRVNLVSTYFGLFLPGDAVAGMASRIRYLGLPTWQDVAMLTIAERLLSLGVASGLALVVYWASSFSLLLGPLPAAAILVIMLVCIVVLRAMSSAQVREWITRVFGRRADLAGNTRISTNWLKTTSIAAAAWALSGLTAYLVLRALAAEVTAVDAFLFSYIVAMVQLVPLFFAGIGIRDVSAIAVLGLIGVSTEIALAASLVGLLLLVVSGLIGGFVQVLEEGTRRR
jgi:glycosyltransferase 2 family protein